MRKYAVTGMALFLSIGVLSGCGKITSLVKDSVTNLEETENEEQELDEFKDVTIDLECADITIKRGESYHLNISRTENYKLSTKVDDKKLEIHSAEDVSGKNGYSATVTINVPKDTELNDMKINLGVGDFSLKGITAAKLNDTQAVGDLMIKKCDIADTRIKADVGDVLFENSNSLDNTTYSLTTDVGTIKFFGERKDSPCETGAGDKTVNVKISVGDISME